MCIYILEFASQNVQVLLRKLFRDLNLLLEEAENGQIAVDYFKQGKNYDLVLMDKEMPVMDGHEVSRVTFHYGFLSLPFFSGKTLYESFFLKASNFLHRFVFVRHVCQIFREIMISFTFFHCSGINVSVDSIEAGYEL